MPHGSFRGVLAHSHGQTLAIAARVDTYETPLARRVIGCAIEVHTTLGPGLLESIYQQCLAHELMLNGLRFVQQVPLPVVYKAIPMGIGFRADFVVEEELLIEIKAVDHVLPLHHTQVLTYLRILGLRQGLMFNFHAQTLISGMRSILNPAFRRPSEAKE